MPSLRASFVPSALTQPIIDGAVRPEGVDLAIETNSGLVTSAIIESNSRRMVALDLDIAEMSFGTYTRARERGLPLIALPIFPGRRFLHRGVIVAPKAGIATPADLRGKRAVLGQFWQTASIWHRVMLNQVYGVRQDEMSWVCLAPERWVALPEPSAPVRFDTSGRDALAVLGAGEADVALLPRGRALEKDGGPNTPRMLFDDVVRAQQAFFEDTGQFPIIHLIVMREEVAGDREPAGALCTAFTQAKEQGRAAMIADPHETPITGGDPKDVGRLFGDDPWPYGIAANQHVLDAYLDDVFSHQHLTDRRLRVDELFPTSLPADFA